jgi:Conserved TM helix
MNTRWGEGVWVALAALADRLATIGPAVLVLITLIVLGLLAGALLRAIVRRLARAIGFDRHMERWGIGSSLRGASVVRAPSEVLGLLFFWATFVIFASLGIDAIAFGRATAFLLAFVPPLFAAVLVLVVGWLVANFLSQGLLIAAVNAGLPEARVLARAVHWGVLLFAAATALTHLGIGKEMVLVAFGITFGGLVFALALAFGLGGRRLARELLERRLRRDSQPARERLTHL